MGIKHVQNSGVASPAVEQAELNVTVGLYLAELASSLDQEADERVDVLINGVDCERAVLLLGGGQPFDNGVGRHPANVLQVEVAADREWNARGKH